MSASLYPDWPSLLKDKRLVLVVTGGVAAYKAVELARLCVKAGAQTRVAMTESATKFVGPLTFESLTRQPCIQDMWKRAQAEIGHVAWAEWAEAMVVAPATANFLAKAAHGLSDDFPSCLLLAHEGPKLMAPAMNSGMWLNPATQANVTLLAQRGIKILVPVCGPLASGRVGPGRLPHPKAILRQIVRLITPKPLSGRSLVITAGATRESWDDIRCLTNRSSGRMGLALAQAAWLLGAKVTLIAGPSLEDPLWSGEDFEFTTAETTRRMLELVEKAFADADGLIMNAAPADFQPARVPGKIKKDGLAAQPLILERTPDILKTLAQKGWERRVVVGFSADDEDLVARALAKLKDKNLDYIAANQAGGPNSAFAAQDIKLTLLNARGEATELGPGPKFGVAWELMTKLAEDPRLTRLEG
ncbi:MAG: bifunctional phosphopantothenoylcysteine decarboxylase/phosphopantothenate--cysteine ligase CoaBC [Deltaproteobacteria bacterium]|jgi:phosphopantothenoylcysteine decarboxylase/phosphopantothenate--cysteine ligase|nr:bifunctional phosphopantothenoylcysteine decarboxylase/phosphopantothenate--cysteine ligase CoaBC [Deltaproteobacteria bacterium]